VDSFKQLLKRAYFTYWSGYQNTRDGWHTCFGRLSSLSH